MPYSRFVQIGRVALVNYGDDEGKLCTIVDVLDHSHVLVDGPKALTGVQRQVVNIRRLALTDLVTKVPRSAKSKVVAKYFTEAGVQQKFEDSAWGQKLARRAKRASTTDFDRFKVMIARKQRASIVNKHANLLKKRK
mmetsp:Transcript_27335/g.87853  ORF Transcript_27335/g.87853 Transcript_27335/m.87853 type:complete len:137 (+) Transcript_27335:49-459(+)|eukprot:CAMPEP_0196782666 /NCGR_PEP_ID=MMETSP1104-20130614/11813_1 /TAXON_ID=33652 /ORGANISM="Cafeteria sp., Strain Caron Lab Isolate" /LENGTH=136 /DNA_ID=CAMNT_0042152909 /DNA_START=49 /DNA_END=459 /DNA_ORIENTATION=+